MAITPQWKLYRLAPRAIEVVGAHRDKEPSIAIYENSLVPAANLLIVAFRSARGFAAIRATEQAEGKAAVATLHTKLRAWVGVVDKHFDDFEVQAFGARPEVPEDVIHDALDLLELSSEYTGTDEEPEFLATMKADLEPAIDLAREEWGEATAAGTTYQDLQRQVREAAATFQRELVAFRRTLGAVLGRSHRDYQRLRAARVRVEDETEDERSGPGTEPAAGDEEAAE